MNRSLFLTVGIALKLFGSSVAWSGAYPRYSLWDDDQDVRVHTGVRGSLYGRQVAIGDFNDDGRPDAAFMLAMDSLPGGTYEVYSTVSLLPGEIGRWPKTLDLMEDRYSIYWERGYPDFKYLLGLTPWNNDPYADLIMFKSGLSVYLGQSEWPGAVKKKTLGDIDVYWNTFNNRKYDFAEGDVDGGGKIDIVLAESSGQPFYDSVFIIPGEPSWPKTSLLDETPAILQWRGFGGALRGTNPVFDWDGDGYADVVLSRAGKIEVMKGSKTLPVTWDAAVDVPPLRLTGSPGWSMVFDLSTDQTGDGRMDVVVRESSGPTVRWRLLEGTAIQTLAGTVGVDDLSPRLLRVGGSADRLAAAGDFDGDGRSDLVWSSTAPPLTRTLVYLAADKPLTGDWTEGASFTIEGEAGEEDECVLKDMDRDGKEDLWIVQKPGGGAYRWHINLFYGFRPLKNPTLRVLDRVESDKRVTLELAVDGEPAEMKVSGDIDDDNKGHWIPFSSRRRVSLTSAPGPKTVTAVFRPETGRESAPVSATVRLSGEGPRVEAVTNRLKGAMSALVVDCRVDGGRLRATVYERGGRRVKTVADEESTGVVTVRWDGRNDVGDRVRPGVYILVVESDGQVNRQEILVEP